MWVMLSISDSFEVEVTLWLSYLNTNIFQIFCQVVNLDDYAEWGNVTLLKHMYALQKSWTEQKCTYILLTSAWCVHSNVYSLGNIQWISYLAVVDAIHHTSSAVQTYHHLTSGSVEIPLLITAWNFSSIGEEPVSAARLIAGCHYVSYTVKSIITFTNVLQGHTTVVLVCCTIEWKPDITCTWEVWTFNRMYKFYIYIPQYNNFYLLSMFNLLRYLISLPF